MRGLKVSLASQLTLEDCSEGVPVTKRRAAAATSQCSGNSWKSCWRNAALVRDGSEELRVGNSQFKAVLEHMCW